MFPGNNETQQKHKYYVSSTALSSKKLPRSVHPVKDMLQNHSLKIDHLKMLLHLNQKYAYLTECYRYFSLRNKYFFISHTKLVLQKNFKFMIFNLLLENRYLMVK